jgi:hypothetical protein
MESICTYTTKAQETLVETMVELYNKTVRLEFGESDHRYLVSKLIKDDVWTEPSPVLGVTSVMGVVAKPALMTYPMNKAIEFLKALNTKPTEEDFRNARRAHIEHSNAGKKAGKVGHALVEALLLNKPTTMPTDKTEREYAESVATAFESWKTDFKPEIISTEEAVYSLSHDFAGTFDLMAKIDGKITLLDFKTTNPSYYNPDGIYAEYFGQLGGYLVAYEEQGGKVDQAMVVNLPKDGSEYKVKSLEDINKTITDAKVYFLSALGLYRSNRDFQ